MIFFPLKSLNKNSDLLVIKVEPGDPVVVTEVNVVIRGDGIKDVDYQKIIKDSKSFIGKRLNHNDYEQCKNKLYNLALSKGYFDAKFQNSQLIVMPSRCQSVWNIDFYSGQRYVFERIKFYGSQIKEDYLKKISNIRSGEYYSATSVMELNRRFSYTNWFESVSISSDYMRLQQKKKIILDIFLYPCAKNNFATGSGYAIDTGPRTKIIWKKPWINAHGHSLETNFSLSKPEQVFDLSYKIPLFSNPLEEYYLLQGGLIHEDTHNVQSSVMTVNIARYWNCSHKWQRSINVHWHFNHCSNNYIIKNIMLIYPGINVSRIRKRGEIIPYWGDSQNYSINISNNCWRSDVNFIAVQVQNVWVRTLLKKHRILARGNLSWIDTPNFSSVDLMLRFFSNVNNGIRGYKHKSLYPDDNSESFVGVATKLITTTFEYQYNVINKWWGAIFIDAGEITNDIKWNSFKSGIGIGARWQLPIGPIKLDVATPLIHKGKINHHFLYLYVSLGPDL
ncbi:autotransporter assembly complex protein TamA [Blochmannia endosymbiont of Camponotus modoc]|uniref:autotransporter assembly complex protein TamA n=1 Tax=Blochmannia endosymbiont of Camponotus modoc TaxID=2945587 RepID=UPI00202519BB|nr:autotransporter assembly complex family protein [Blochmannia endosymbiont of Camponotus modoc]URJ29345.1 autotransporter assembly complex protein TamA [Blochmannia endosymbiont of Camponotus modoc]